MVQNYKRKPEKEKPEPDSPRDRAKRVRALITEYNQRGKKGSTS